MLIRTAIKKMAAMILTEKTSIAVEIACAATVAAFEIWHSGEKDD